MGNGPGRGSSSTVRTTVTDRDVPSPLDNRNMGDIYMTWDERHGAYPVDESSAEVPLSAAKYDTGKPRMDLLDPLALEQLARVLTFGAEKYEANNWRKGMKWSRIQASLLRHIAAFMDGQDMDPETGLPHIAHAMCNCMFLLRYMEDHREGDDRYSRTE